MLDPASRTYSPILLQVELAEQRLVAEGAAREAQEAAQALQVASETALASKAESDLRLAQVLAQRSQGEAQVSAAAAALVAESKVKEEEAERKLEGLRMELAAAVKGEEAASNLAREVSTCWF